MKSSVFQLRIIPVLAAVLVWVGMSTMGCTSVDGGGGGGGDHADDHGGAHAGDLVHLDEPVDPTGARTAEDHAVIGHKEVDGRIVELILEPAKSMFMLMGGNWMEMAPAAGADIHVEVKITDPGSKDRPPHSAIEFHAENETTGEKMEEELHPMWGGSGLHYAINHGLLGDGQYHAEIHLEEPRFARSLGDKDKWMGNVEAEFHFVIEDGLVTEVSVSSGAAPASPTTPVPAHEAATLPADPTSDEVFMGEATTDNMRIQLILEPAKAMWMYMGGMWMEMAPAVDETIHVEVKPIDEGSGTRISYATVTFTATNTSTGESITEELHSMWGGSGLHYAINHGLLGAGDYTASVTVDVPEFARSMSDSDKWMTPIQADFTFAIDDAGLVTATEGHTTP
ncbi:MAG: iron transporter [Proteobacteria bacterium]|nr:iron transporter [Pseudomonadota bacterium]